jgi:aminopeptidase YwaD
MRAEKYTDYMYRLIDRVIEEIGPRGSCSDEEKRLGGLFEEEIAPACERVEKETFTCSPTAFLGFFPYLVLMYLAGVACYYFFPPAAAFLAAGGGFTLFMEVVRYREFTDPLFPKAEGENVAGFVKPRGEVKRRVYVSAHLDSAYEFKLWLWFKNLAATVMGLAFLAVLLLFGFGLARSVAEPTGLPQATAFKVMGIILIAFCPLIILFFFFHTSKLVPGAMDDMAGIAVLAGLGRYLVDERESGGFHPENTEVVLLGLSSEEAGLRGAKRYARRHAKEADELPTSGIFLDGICDERYFTVFTREVWPGAKMDPGLVEVACESAKSRGCDITSSMLPLGATDASAFALAGIPSVSLCLVDNSRLAPNYHTRYDTIDNIRPRSLTVALETVIEMLERIDRGSS